MLTAMRNFFGRKPDNDQEPDFDIVVDDDLDEEGFTIIDGDDFNLEDYLVIADGGDGHEINMRYRSRRKPLNFNRITDNIFLGSCPGTEEEVQRLKAAGVTAVINLQTDFDFTKKEIDWEKMVEYYKAAGIAWKRNPTIDYNDADLRKKVPLGLLWMDEFIKQEHIVYVHCNSGINRSPTLVAAYLHLQGLGIQSAINYVLSRRQSWPDKDAILIGCRIFKWHKYKIRLSEEQKKQIVDSLSTNLASIRRSEYDNFDDAVGAFIARCREILIEEIEGGIL